MRPTRVVIADDDDAVRDALDEVLEADPRFTVVGLAVTGNELQEVALTTLPDLVLLDVRMPGGGAHAARTLLASPSPPVVIAVSADTGTSTVVAMMRAGAVGYLAKGSLSALPDLVARCVDGEVVLAVPSAAEALLQLG